MLVTYNLGKLRHTLVFLSLFVYDPRNVLCNFEVVKREQPVGLAEKHVTERPASLPRQTPIYIIEIVIFELSDRDYDIEKIGKHQHYDEQNDFVESFAYQHSH